jgi:natural product precursor
LINLETLKIRNMKKLKLIQLSKDELEKKDLTAIKGGDGGVSTPGYCSCACRYANQGGSSTDGNGMASADNGYHYQ